jgi:outer membrane protein assembly factor BamB
LVNGIAYTGSTNGYIYALDASTGEQKRAFDIGEKLATTPVIADGRIYLGTQSGHLYIIE